MVEAVLPAAINATVGNDAQMASRLSADKTNLGPNGRSNHYLFLIWRDGLAITQPETAGRVKVPQSFYKPHSG